MLGVLIVSACLLLLKFIAYYLTGSNGILSDASESIVNVIAGGIALFSVYFASKPKDSSHPYGHGKVEFFSAGLEGTLILIAGLAVAIKSVSELIYPKPLESLEIGALMTLGTAGINWAAGRYLIILGKKEHSITLEAEGKHLMSDVYSSLGLSLGLLFVYFTDWEFLDSILGLIFSGIIIFTGIKLVRASVAGLMDESDPEMLQKFLQALNSEHKKVWVDIYNLRIRSYGAVLHVDAQLVLPFFFTLEQAGQEIIFLESILKKCTTRRMELCIIPEACSDEVCFSCENENCGCHLTTSELNKPVYTVDSITQTESTRSSVYKLKQPHSEKEAADI